VATQTHDVRSTTDAVEFDRSGRHVTAYLSGELDAQSTPTINAAIQAQVRPGDECVWLDMSTTTFCDSTGITMLFNLHMFVEATGATFVVFSPTKQVRRIIDICDPTHTLAVRGHVKPGLQSTRRTAGTDHPMVSTPSGSRRVPARSRTQRRWSADRR